MQEAITPTQGVPNMGLPVAPYGSITCASQFSTPIGCMHKKNFLEPLAPRLETTMVRTYVVAGGLEEGGDCWGQVPEQATPHHPQPGGRGGGSEPN